VTRTDRHKYAQRAEG